MMNEINNPQMYGDSHKRGYSAWNLDFSKAWTPLDIAASYKQYPEDFMVEEHNSIKLSGKGEHCWVYIKKKNCNTDWLAQKLARYCGVTNKAVSYAGLKDRHAVTSQWFSIQLPGLATPNWVDFEETIFDVESKQSVQVLQSVRHARKLQRGALTHNQFTITLRNLSDDSEEAWVKVQQRCKLIAQRGVPNYFGPQRFGKNASNLSQAEKMFSQPGRRLQRQKRSLYLSAARSWLFNYILSQRIDEGVWDKRLQGDVFMLAGKSACFRDEDDNPDQINCRLERNEIHPTAVLWGVGEPMVSSSAAALEAEIIDQFPAYRNGLQANRVKSQRRSCRIMPAGFTCHRQQDVVVLSFSLPPGSYATIVLGEIFSPLLPTG